MNILVIKQGLPTKRLIKESLEAYSYTVDLREYNYETKRLIKQKIFDVMIICTDYTDIGKILKNVNDNCPRMKVLGICDNGTWVEKVRFLNSGGDDVLTFPFPLQELIARVRSLTRREIDYTASEICLGDLSLDTKEKAAYKKNHNMQLRQKEYDLLEYLLKNKNRTVSRCELLDHVWDYRKYIGSNTVDVHIKRLRDKLEEPDLIETVHGVGYKIIDPNDTKTKASSASQDE